MPPTFRWAAANADGAMRGLFNQLPSRVSQTCSRVLISPRQAGRLSGFILWVVCLAGVCLGAARYQAVQPSFYWCRPRQL
ncbi:MAG: hypothetical protein PVI99_09340 [Anaerolineales bacterium]